MIPYDSKYYQAGNSRKYYVFLSLQDYTLSSNTTYNLDTLIRLLKAESLYEIVRKKIE